MHLWTADTQTSASRQQWRHTLDQMIALHPQRVIPGHYLGTPPEGDSAVRLQNLSPAVRAGAEDAFGFGRGDQGDGGTVAGPGGDSSLELSAKVNTGEMKW